MTKVATEQAKVIKRKPSPINGQVLPAGFEAHPERRHNGSWKKEDTPRYKLEQMMKLSESDLLLIAKDKDAPYFERKLAIAINKGEWKEIESMINQVYGQPKLQVESMNIEPPKPLFSRSDNAKNASARKDTQAKKAN